MRLPVPLYRHATVLADNGGIYVIGGQTRDANGDDLNQSQVYYIPPLSLTKSNDPSGPVHEGDVITYTIAYANTSLTTHNITITDVLPFNVTLIPGSDVPAAIEHGPELVWRLGDVPPGDAGQVSFKARVALLPSLHREEISAESISPPPEDQPTYVLPVPISCDTTRFWANGVTRQPPVPNPLTIQVQIPPESNPSQMWLAVKGVDDLSLTVDGSQAERIAISDNDIGASLWSVSVTADAIANGTVTVVTDAPRRLNAIFLFNQGDPPFDELALDDFYNTAKTFTYPLDIPSVATQTIDVILPFFDITYWTDSLYPDDRRTEVTVQFDNQSHTIVASNPNLGNGLLMTQFPFEIGGLDTYTATKVLTVTVNTEDFVYTLGPRVCRPVYIENTVWMCSDKAGCIASTVRNIPENFRPPGGIYLPFIVKFSS